MNIVKNGKIDISEIEWVDLNNRYTKDEIKIMIHEAIETNNLAFPLREISRQDADEDFSKLKNFDTKQLLVEQPWFTRYEYKYPITYNGQQVIIKANNAGNKTSDFYHQVNRMMCDSMAAPSPYRSWTNRKFRDGMLGALWTLKVPKINDNTFRTAVALRKYMAAQFRCSSAKAMYDLFGTKRTLDLSSGWGDRLMGFAASDATTYVGFDPNANLAEGYQGEINDYCNGKDAKVICSGSEFLNDHLEPTEMFDLIFTSPPYFNIEKYTQDETQSFKKFRKIEAWLEGFLFETLKQAWEHLEVGGHMAINISDVYSNHRINQICDPMNDFIATLPNAEYVGALGYEMRKRPNSGALKGKDGAFAEPIWVWKKIKTSFNFDK